MLTNNFMCNKIITHKMFYFEMGTKMGNIAVIMPVIGVIGFIIIAAIILVIRSREKIKSSMFLMPFHTRYG